MDTETLPFYFENLSATDEELVNKNFGRSSSARGLGRCDSDFILRERKLECFQ